MSRIGTWYRDCSAAGENAVVMRRASRSWVMFFMWILVCDNDVARSLFQPLVRILYPSLPVLPVHGVFTRPDEVAETTVHQHAHLRIAACRDPLARHEPVSSVGSLQHRKLTLGIRP